MSSDIAVIGMAVEAPGARDLASFWDLIASGRSLTRPFPQRRRHDIDDFVRYHRESVLAPYTDQRVDFHDGCYLDRIDQFDPAFFGMTPKQASVADPHQRLILRNMYLALEDAGYTGDRIRGRRAGVYVGFAANPGQGYLEYVCRIDPSLAQVGLTGNLPTMLANRLSYLYDLRGPSMIVDSACSASLVALHQARTALLMGDCELAVVAGSRVVVAPIRHPHTRIGIESSDGVTRTFDDRADGTGFGEGSGVVVLKRLDQALADRDQIHAVIKGSAVNHDGHSEAMTSPDASAQADLLVAAWRAAGIDPTTLGYLEAHGTATRIGDPLEHEGLRLAFARYTDRRQFCAVGTVKANIGHLFEGSGMLGLIKAALVLKHRAIPPVANFTEPNSRIDFAAGPVYVPTELTPWDTTGPRRCGVSAFGLGGTNAHVVLEEAPPAPHRTAVAAPPYLFTLSAHSELSLRRTAGRYLDELDRDQREPAGLSRAELADVCYTSNVSRSGHPYRLALVVTDHTELRSLLAGLLDRDQLAGAVATAPPAGGSAPELPIELRTLAAGYVAGEPVDLVSRYGDRTPRTVPLPPYQFDESRCWLDFPTDWRRRLSGGALGGGASVGHPDTHEVTFVPTPPPGPAGTEAESAELVAIVDPATGVESRLTELGLDRIEYVRTTPDWEELAERVADAGHTHLVHALGFESEPAADVAELDRRVRKNLLSLFQLSQALMAAGARLTLVVLTRQSLAVPAGAPGTVTENAALAGLTKAIAQEYPYLSVRFLDVDDQVPAERLRPALLATEPGVYALRGTDTYREAFAELPDFAPGAVAGAAEDTAENRPNLLRPGGAYLITGGTGAIGLAVARHFAATLPHLHLFLLSRTGLPPRAEWEQLLRAEPPAPEADRIRAVQQLEAQGVEVFPVRGDVSDADDLRQVVTGIREKYGRLDGIVHAAGIPGENLISFRTVEDFLAVLRPKLRGAFLLDQLTRADRPDFVLHLSSVASVFPALGQSDYAAANYYLDALARANSEPGYRVLSVNWVAWREVGMAVATGDNQDMIFRSLRTDRALEILDAALASDRRQLFAGEINYDSELMDLLRSYPLELSPVITDKIERGMAALAGRLRLAAEQLRRELEAVEVTLTGRPDNAYTPAELLVGRCVAHAFGSSTLDIRADFMDLGGDSITALTVANNIATCLGRPFDAVELLSERTVVAVAGQLDYPTEEPAWTP